LYSRTTIFIDKKNSSKLWKRGIHCRLHSTQFCFQVKIKRTTTEQIQCAIRLILYSVRSQMRICNENKYSLMCSCKAYRMTKRGKRIKTKETKIFKINISQIFFLSLISSFSFIRTRMEINSNIFFSKTRL
jgi:hypothetical protein